MSAALQIAIRQVETLGIAPLKRVAAARPRGYNGASWYSYLSRRAEAEQSAIAALEEAGAVIRRTPHGTAFKFASIRATSTQGLLAALTNWLPRAKLQRESER